VSVRLRVVLSDDLNRDLDAAAEKSASDKGEILRKAIQLYLAAKEGKDKGLRLGLIDPWSGEMKTEIVGL